MLDRMNGSSVRVGPVLIEGEVARAIAQCVVDTHPDAQVVDRGAYLRITATGSCRVTRTAIELLLGRPFRLPGDLERVMPSFMGRFVVTRDDATWRADVA